MNTPYQRLARQVKRTPEAIAASAGDIRVSYRELASRVSAISHRLVLEGVGQDVLVILLAERGPDLLAAMLAVQRAGGAFLPLDPTIPPERLAQILQHSRAPVVLTGRTRSVALEAVTAMGLRAGPKVLALDDLCHAKTANVSPRFRPSPSNLAYVICTSGSTGVPKGAMVEQRGLSNQLVSLVSDLQLSKSDVIAHTSPASFVISVWQFLTAIMVGARVHICSDEAIRVPTLLVQEVERQGVTVCRSSRRCCGRFSTGVGSRSLRGSLNQLRWLISTGEALPPDLCRDWLQCYPHVPVVNAYGSLSALTM